MPISKLDAFRCASLDGDADRLVYFYPATNGEVTLLDGDHICALFARFIIEVSKFPTYNITFCQG
jgi:phosphomannomutase